MAKRRAKAAKSQPPEIRKVQESPSVERKPDGTFAKGVSGCPGGRPSIAREIREMAQADSPEAYARVRAIMLDNDHRNQLPAAIAVLKMAGVALNAADGQNPAPPPALPPGAKVPSTVDLEAVAGSPQGHLQ